MVSNYQSLEDYIRKNIEKELNSRINNASKKTRDTMYRQLQTSIRKNVYGERLRPLTRYSYDRSNEFSQSFRRNRYKHTKTLYTYTFEYTPVLLRMHRNPNNKWISHGWSIGKNRGISFTWELAEVLNYQYGTGILRGQKLRNGSYWDEFTKKANRNNVKTMFIKYLKQHK